MSKGPFSLKFIRAGKDGVVRYHITGQGENDIHGSSSRPLNEVKKELQLSIERLNRSGRAAGVK